MCQAGPALLLLGSPVPRNALEGGWARLVIPDKQESESPLSKGGRLFHPFFSLSPSPSFSLLGPVLLVMQPPLSFHLHEANPLPFLFQWAQHLAREN